MEKNNYLRRRAINDNMGGINTNELTKLYYSISEVAEMLNVNMSLIRFWEKEFPVLQPKKNKRGTRYYSPKEIEKLNRIYSLVKEQGYTLEGAKKALRFKQNNNVVDLSETGSEPLNETEIIEKLEIVKSKLLSIKNRM